MEADTRETIFAIFFFVLVVVGLASILVEIMMRIRLSRREVPAEKLLWWRRGGDDVADAYQELFPETHLPILRKFVFWTVVAAAFALLASFLWKLA